MRLRYLALICSISFPAISSHAAEVGLELRTSRQNYRIGENVTLEFVFKNLSSEPIKFFPDPESYELQTLAISPVNGAGVVERVEIAERGMDWEAWSKDAVVIPASGSHIWRLTAQFRRHLPSDWKEYLLPEFQKERLSNPYLVFHGEAFRLPGFGKYHVSAKYNFQSNHPVIDYIHGNPRLWFGKLQSPPIIVDLKR